MNYSDSKTLGSKVLEGPANPLARDYFKSKSERIIEFANKFSFLKLHV